MFTATMMKKLITKLVREEEPGLSGPLSQQLGHSEKTNEGRNQLKISQTSSARIVKTVSATLGAASVVLRFYGPVNS